MIETLRLSSRTKALACPPRVRLTHGSRAQYGPAGNISEIVRSLQRYHADPDTVRAAVQAITDYVLKRPTSEEAQVALGRDDGIAAITSAMRMHIADESVGTMCAIALRSVADTAENRVAVVDTGGVAAMAEACRLHPDNPELVKWAAAALRNLVDPGEACRVPTALALGTFLLPAAAHAPAPLLHTSGRGRSARGERGAEC